MEILPVNAIRLLLLLTMLLTSAGRADANLVGDTVTLAHHCCALGTVAVGGGPTNVTVQTGTGDRILFYYNLYFVDVEAQSIRVDFNAPNTWDSGYEDGFNGLVVSSLEGTSPPMIVTGFSSIDTNLAGWDDARASFDDHSVAFNWDHLSFTAASYFEATLELQQIPPDPVPSVSPLGMALLGGLVFAIALTGLSVQRRRRAG
jgi:hypothetical protein